MKRTYLLWWVLAIGALVLNLNIYTATGRYLNLIAAALWVTVFGMLGWSNLQKVREYEAAKIRAMKAAAEALEKQNSHSEDSQP